VDSILKDLRYATRLFTRTPGFTIVAVLALAIAIGANTAIFSVVNGVLLRPLPFKEPDRLVHVFRTQPPIMRGPISRPDFFEWQAQATEFKQLAAFTAATVNITGTDQSERVAALQVTRDFFALFGVSPAAGRFFIADDDSAGSPSTAVISYGLWQRKFAADSAVIGSTLILNDEPTTIIGVAPQNFNFSWRADIWIPARLDESKNQRGSNYLQIIARLRDETTIARANAQMNQVAAGLAERFPDTDSNLTVTIIPLLEAQVRNIRPVLLVLLASVGCVLLIACANVANLMLARATAREKEIAIRAALGCSRARVVRQLLTESLLLGVAGGTLGMLLAWWGVKALLRLAPANPPRSSNVGMDGWVLCFTAIISVGTGVLFGLAPALHISKRNLLDRLKEGARSMGSEHRSRLRNGLVVGEMAMSLTLLIAAGLLIESERRMAVVDPGFDPKPVLTANVSFPRHKFAGTDAEKQSKELQETSQFLVEVTKRLKSLPGVIEAGAINDLPVTGYSSINGNFTIEGQPKPKPGEEPVAEYRWVTPDYFRAVGVPLIAGRAFDQGDGPDRPSVIIVNESFAGSFFPSESPLGHRVKSLNDQFQEIVGVVGNARQWGLDRPPDPEIYFPYSQSLGTDPTLVLRTNVDPSSLGSAVRDTVRRVNPDAPLYGVRPMLEVVDRATSQQRFNATLMTTFALVALILAGIGLYGVISYSVSQRTREIGVRMALGAQRADVLRLVIGHGVVLTATGVALGIGAALYAMRFLEGMLFGVSATDLSTFALVSVVLSLIAIGATSVPAYRAMRVDPMKALRCE